MQKFLSSGLLQRLRIIIISAIFCSCFYSSAAFANSDDSKKKKSIEPNETIPDKKPVVTSWSKIKELFE